MNSFSRLRVYHSALAILAISTYLLEDLKDIHAWFGYAVTALLAFRLFSLAIPKLFPRAAWVISKGDNQPERGLQNPIISKAFIFGIMACLTVTVSTGIVMRQTATVKLSDVSFIQSAYADEKGKKATSPTKKLLKGIHELSANGMLALVGLHVGYLLLFRRKFATRMIFIE